MKTVFLCRNCGAQSMRWQGQCHQCQQWNCIVEEPCMRTTTSATSSGMKQATTLKDIPLAQVNRWSTGFSELDHVLGGGFMPDSVILIGGDPGIGKSTLLLQVATESAKNHDTLYVSGEESLQQIALRAQRLSVSSPGLALLTETSVERIISETERLKPRLLIVDSIQTVCTESLESVPGSLGQVRESAAKLVRFAKNSGTILILVGHVTKEGALAGPRVLEHMVDTVLYFENHSDGRFRIIRTVKNRFGSVNEIGIFAMTDRGLSEIKHPSAIFLSRDLTPHPGSITTVSWEGTRPLLIEVQTLVDDSHLQQPRRVTVGVDPIRFSMLLAILNRHGRLPLFQKDVFTNIVGGLKIFETGIDLGILLSVASSFKEVCFPRTLAVFGEVGLSGEIRPISHGSERIREAHKHGFTHLIVPKENAPKKNAPVHIIPCVRLQEVLQAALALSI